MITALQRNNDKHVMMVVLQLETTPDHCRLFVDKARREDSGPYTITAENPYGKDSASIEVKKHTDFLVDHDVKLSVE